MNRIIKGILDFAATINRRYVEPALAKRRSRSLAKNKIKSIGRPTVIADDLEVNKEKGIIVGKNVFIDAGGHIDAIGGVVIGDGTRIGRGVAIYSSRHVRSEQATPNDNKYACAPVIIEPGATIEPGVTITPGVTIGRNATIGMGSVVVANVAPGTEVCGNPAAVRQPIGPECRTPSLATEAHLVANGKRTAPARADYIPLTETDSERIVFVLSTGRSGSKSIAATLANSNRIQSAHEPNFNLIRLSAELLAGKKSTEEAGRELRDYYQHTSTFRSDNQLYIESDQKLAPFVPQLKELFPRAKFIWIFRKPEGFIRSASARTWFKVDAVENIREHDILMDTDEQSMGMRLGGNIVDGIPQPRWDAYTLLERNAWYWTYWNKLIEHSLGGVPASDKFVVELSQLNSSMAEISTFLGVEPIKDENLMKTNQVKKQHVTNLDDIGADELSQASARFCNDYYQHLHSLRLVR
jgi:acetyltransferase-like isoleucine patch superfamily enzyme